MNTVRGDGYYRGGKLRKFILLTCKLQFLFLSFSAKNKTAIVTECERTTTAIVTITTMVATHGVAVPQTIIVATDWDMMAINGAMTIATSGHGTKVTGNSYWSLYG